MPAAVLLASAALALSARAASGGAGRGGWSATESSLLLRDSSGTLVTELALEPWEERASAETALRHLSRGGISSDGRFAWSWEKAEEVRKDGRAKPRERSRLLRYWGTFGQELWSSERADTPGAFGPAAQSRSGERVLVLERSTSSWSACAYDFLGRRLFEFQGRGVPEGLRLSPSGRFGWVRWRALDEPPWYAFFDSERKKLREVPAYKLPPAPVRIEEDGGVYAGSKLVLELDRPR